MSRETKLGFAFVFVLLAVFGFVVYKKVQQGRAERGDLLASVQAENAQEESAKSSDEASGSVPDPLAQNSAPPEQSFNQFPEPTPAPSELTAASWDQQSFEPPPQHPVAEMQPVPTPVESSESISEFPPVETASAPQFDPEAQNYAATEAQSQAATPIPPNSEPSEFTPVPDSEFAQVPVPQGFEPPAEFSNPPVPQEMPAAQPLVEEQNVAGEFAPPTQMESVPSAADFENEQFSTQSEPVPTEATPTPAGGNPFGDLAASPTEQPIPPAETLPAQSPAPEAAGNDPFAATPQPAPAANESFDPAQVTESAPTLEPPAEMIPVQSAPPTELAQPNPLPVQEVEPTEIPLAKGADSPAFEPIPTDNQYEPDGSEESIGQLTGVPNELPEDSSFAQVPSTEGLSPAPTMIDANERVQVYEVRPGDNYWKISKTQYGTVRYFTALARYNQQRIPDPKKMRPGMKVLTPTREVLEARNPDLFPKFAANTGDVSGVGHNADGPTGFYLDEQGQPMYRVGPDDTLGGIAQKHLGRFSRWVEIYQLNRHRLKDPNALTLGDVLQLPADASRVSMVRHASGVR